MKKSQTSKSKIIKNLGANFYGQIITVAIQLISVPVFLHYWGVSVYGEWLLLSAIPAYLSLTDIGFASVAANEMSMLVIKGDKKGVIKIYQSIWVFVCLASTVVALAIVLAVLFTPINYRIPLEVTSVSESRVVLIILIVYVLFGLQGNILSAAFRAAGKYSYSTVLSNNVRLAEWISTLAIVMSGGGMTLVASVNLVVRVLGLAITWKFLHDQEKWLNLGFTHASKQSILLLLKPAIAFMAFPLGLALSLQGTIIIIGSILGANAVVVFSAYRTLTRLVVQLITMLNQALWPEISIAFGAQKNDFVKNLHRKGAAVTYWIALTVVMVLGLSGDWIIGIWTRHAFEQHAILFSLLLFGTFLNVNWQTSWVVLMATNKHEKIALVFVLISAVALITNILSISILGLNGVGVVLVFFELPLLLIVTNSALQLLGDNWKTYLRSVFLFPGTLRH